MHVWSSDSIDSTGSWSLDLNYPDYKVGMDWLRYLEYDDRTALFCRCVPRAPPFSVDSVEALSWLRSMGVSTDSNQ